MLEKILEKYNYINFVCINKNEAYQFVDDITQFITFQITSSGKKFIQSPELIKSLYFKHLSSVSNNIIYVLVCKTILSETPYIFEYRIYSRNQYDYDNYNDWDKFKEINYSNYLKTKKLLLLKAIINEKNQYWG